MSNPLSYRCPKRGKPVYKCAPIPDIEEMMFNQTEVAIFWQCLKLFRKMKLNHQCYSTSILIWLEANIVDSNKMLTGKQRI